MKEIYFEYASSLNLELIIVILLLTYGVNNTVLFISYPSFVLLINILN